VTAPDHADSENLKDALEAILPALENFNRFEGDDASAREKEWKAVLEEGLPGKGIGLEGVLGVLADTVIPNGARNGMPGFSGWVTTAPTSSATAAALAGMVAGSQRWWLQAFNTLELVALDWLKELLGFPKEWQGTFNSGGSVANLIGVAAGRQYAFERIGVDPAQDGLPADIRWRLYASEEIHHVVHRSAAILGLGRSSLAHIPVDDEFRIDLKALEAELKADKEAGVLPVAVIATAGTVNTGTIDPLEEMADLADEYGTWLHVDGAYGGFGVLDERVASLYKGIERADSVAVDPHKWMAIPIGCGSTFVRDRELMGRAFNLGEAEYLEGAIVEGEVHSTFDNFGELFHHFNLEQSSPSRGARVWAVLKEIGKEGMRERVVRHNSFARSLAKLVKADARLELLSEPVLSICCFRYHAPGMKDAELNDLNTAIASRLRAEGKYIPSTTVLNERLAIRPCYINPRTTHAEVDGLAQRVREIGDEIGDEMAGEG
jgi:glutamate/tyrosine decarboxylase-like PLP-dependent enzyme